MRNFITVLLTILIVVSLVNAQPNIWEPRGAGGGGALFLPSFSPHNPGELFMSCDMSEPFHTTDFGASWDIVDSRQLQTNNHLGFVQYTSDPLIMYTINNLTESPFLAKSTDGGKTLKKLTSDPTSGGAFYLVTDYNSVNNVMVTDYSNFYFSSDGGNSFTKKWANATGAGIFIGGAFFDGNNFYIGTNKGILASTDGGSSFSIMTLSGMAGSESIISFAGAKQGIITRFYCLTVDSNDIYGGITSLDKYPYKGVYTLDLGQNAWQKKITGITAGAMPFFIGCARNNIDIAYLGGGSNSSNPTVFKSTNGGSNWVSVLNTTNNQNIMTGWQGYQGDRDWSYGEYACGFAVSPVDANIVLISDLGMCHITTDGGSNWKVNYVDQSSMNPANSPIPPKVKATKPPALKTRPAGICYGWTRTKLLQAAQI